MTEQTSIPIPAAAEEHGGHHYMKDAKGSLVPLGVVKAVDLLMDELVRKIAGYAEPLSEQIGRFKAHTFDDVDGFLALIAQEHGATMRGTKGKGNLTLTSYDGTIQVKVAVADSITFGPELKIAKDLVDECLNEWADGAHEHLRAVVQRAFNTDKEGLVNRAELFSLLRLDIADERWKRAMNAIRESMRVIGSKRYVRVYRRETPEGALRLVNLDVAGA